MNIHLVHVMVRRTNHWILVPCMYGSGGLLNEYSFCVLRDQADNSLNINSVYAWVRRIVDRIFIRCMHRSGGLPTEYCVSGVVGLSGLYTLIEGYIPFNSMLFYGVVWSIRKSLEMLISTLSVRYFPIGNLMFVCLYLIVQLGCDKWFSLRPYIVNNIKRSNLSPPRSFRKSSQWREIPAPTFRTTFPSRASRRLRLFGWPWESASTFWSALGGGECYWRPPRRQIAREWCRFSAAWKRLLACPPRQTDPSFRSNSSRTSNRLCASSLGTRAPLWREFDGDLSIEIYQYTIW